MHINPGSDEPAKYTVVPRGHVWLQGDNLPNSTDSRSYGPIPAALIMARVIARVGDCLDAMHVQLTPTLTAHAAVGLAAVAGCCVRALAQDGAGGRRGRRESELGERINCSKKACIVNRRGDRATVTPPWLTVARPVTET